MKLMRTVLVMVWYGVKMRDIHWIDIHWMPKFHFLDRALHIKKLSHAVGDSVPASFSNLILLCNRLESEDSSSNLSFNYHFFWYFTLFQYLLKTVLVAVQLPNCVLPFPSSLYFKVRSAFPLSQLTHQGRMSSANRPLSSFSSAD